MQEFHGSLMKRPRRPAGCTASQNLSPGLRPGTTGNRDVGIVAARPRPGNTKLHDIMLCLRGAPLMILASSILLLCLMPQSAPGVDDQKVAAAIEHGVTW